MKVTKFQLHLKWSDKVGRRNRINNTTEAGDLRTSVCFSYGLAKPECTTEAGSKHLPYNISLNSHNSMEFAFFRSAKRSLAILPTTE